MGKDIEGWGGGKEGGWLQLVVKQAAAIWEGEEEEGGGSGWTAGLLQREGGRERGSPAGREQSRYGLKGE
eukprot:scaffold33670_cov112-Isochrysis_galbana.AAC.1